MYNIRDIAMLLDAQTSRNTLNVAARFASNYGAHITAFFYVPALPAIPVAVSTRNSFEVMQQYVQNCRQEAELACLAFDEVMEREGVLSNSVIDDGHASEMLINRFKYADVVIVQRATTGDTSATESMHERILLQSGRPVLLIPKDYESHDFAKSVVVAWDGSKEATRAVHDSMPILSNADSVEILHVINDSQLPVGRLAQANHDEIADRLVLHLERNNIQVTVSTQRKHTGGTGATVMDHATGSGADLIVSGAWGHRRLWEYAFGGATRALLNSASTPVLMSH